MLNKLIGQTGRHSKGSTLIMVLIVFAVLMLLGTAALTASTVSTNVTATTAKKQQANLIAQSAAKAAVAYILGNTNIQSALSSLTVGSSMPGGADFGSRGGTNTITVTAVSATVFKVTVTSSYNHVNGQAVVYLTKSGSAANLALPTNYLYYVSGAGSFNSTNNGMLLSNGNFTVTGGQQSGQIFVNGSTTIKNAGITLQDITSLNNIDMESGTVTHDLISGGTTLIENAGVVVGGNIYSHSDMTLEGAAITGLVKTNGNFTIANSGGSIGGSVYSDGTATISGGTVSGSVYSSGNVTINGGTINGNLYTNGTLTMNGGEIKGSVYAGGNITVNSGSGGVIDQKAVTNGTFTVTNHEVACSVYATGGVTINNWGSIDGDVTTGSYFTLNAGEQKGNVYAKGDISVYNWSNIDKSAYTNGNLNLQPGSVHGNAYAAAVSISGGGVSGSTTRGSNYGVNPGYDYSYVSGGNAVAPLPAITLSYSPVSLHIVLPPSQASDPQLYQPVSIDSNNTISSDGTLTGNTNPANDFDPTASRYQGKMLTIDATNHDVSLLLNKDLSINNYNCQGIRVIGTHNVYLYLNNCSTINLAGSYIGPADTSSPPDVFFIGNNQTINASNASIYGYIYIPNGSYQTSTSNNPYSPSGMNVQYFFNGIMTVANISTQWGCKMQYVQPNYAGTPLANAISGGSLSVGGISDPSDAIGAGSSGGSTWSLSGWAAS